MNWFYLDASAAIKRYQPERGSDRVNALFGGAAGDRLLLLTPGLGETLSALVRRRNAGDMSADAYRMAARALVAEVVESGRFRLQASEDRLVFLSLELIERHSINSTDALVLRSALEVESALKPEGDALVLIASDARLLRAAAAEGLDTLNPESDTLERLESLIAAP